MSTTALRALVLGALVLVAWKLTAPPPPGPPPMALIHFPPSPLILPENKATDPALANRTTTL